MANKLRSITFKPCNETAQLDLTLSDLATVNILVGANGAGKTRVLRGIKLAKYNPLVKNRSDFIVTDPPDTPIASAEIQQKSENLFGVDYQATLDFFWEAIRELSVAAPLTKQALKVKTPAPVGAINNDIETVVDKYHFNGIPIGFGDNPDATESYFSSGTIRLAQLLEGMETIQVVREEDGAVVFLVDEIETALHPSAHKLALKKIIELTRSTNIHEGQTAGGSVLTLRREIQLGASLTSPVRHRPQVFISTHSPFVIAAAAEYDASEVKVYLLKDGKTWSVKNEPGGTSGYGGMESLFAANWMLGASQSDYIPSKIILAEESIQQFIKMATKSLGLSLSSYQASTSGDSKTQIAARTLLEIAKDHLEFGRMQPWKTMLSLQVQVLLDGKPTAAEQRQWDSLITRFGGSISVDVISEAEFENLHPPQMVAKFLESKKYPIWASGTFKDYSEKLADIAGLHSRKDVSRAIGKLKCDLSTFVAESIDINLLKGCYPKLLPYISNDPRGVALPNKEASKVRVRIKATSKRC
jgi:hypothetical protein